jgi:hypothetical protein
VYFRPNGQTGVWYPLPYNNGGVQITLTAVSLGKVTVAASPTQNNLDFKIVIIPGTSLTNLNVTNPNLNFRNYSQVARALNLRN